MMCLGWKPANGCYQAAGVDIVNVSSTQGMQSDLATQTGCPGGWFWWVAGAVALLAVSKGKA